MSPNGSAGGVDTGMLQGLLPLIVLGLTVLPSLPPVLAVFLVIGGFFFLASQLAVASPSTDEPKAQKKEQPLSEMLELYTDTGLHLVAMKAAWGSWPAEASEALLGEARFLPARALADPTMRRTRDAMAGRIAVLRRQELRAMGVRSWCDVMEAVAATRAKGLLIVNATDELVSADMQPGRHSSVPTAILRKSAGEALLQLLEKKTVHLQNRGAADVALARAEELNATGRHGEAARVLAEGAKGADPKTAVRMQILRAETLRLAGRSEEAVEEARAAVGADPESADGWVEVVRALRAANQTAEAQKDSRLSKLVAELSRSPEEVASERKATGNALFKEHRYTEARDAYTSALDVLSSSGDTEELRAACLGNRAACSQQLHDYDGVVADATQALLIQPGNLKVRLRRAAAYEALERYADALMDAREVLRVESRHPHANSIQHRAGRALRELGLPDPGRASCPTESNGSAPSTSAAVGQESTIPESNSATPSCASNARSEHDTSIENAHTANSAASKELAPGSGKTEGEASSSTACPTIPEPVAPQRPRELGLPKGSQRASPPAPPLEPAPPSPTLLQPPGEIQATPCDSRSAEPDAELTADAAARLELERRCMDLERKLEEVNTKSADHNQAADDSSRGSAASGSLANQELTVGQMSSPSRAVAIAARKGQQMERLMAVLHEGNGGCNSSPSSPNRDDQSARLSPLGGGASGSDTRSVADSPPPTQESAGMCGGDSNGISGAKMAEGDWLLLERELHKSRREEQHLRHMVEGFRKRFQVRSSATHINGRKDH